MQSSDLVKLRDSIAEKASPSDKALLSQLEIKDNNGDVLVICPNSFTKQLLRKEHHETISCAVESCVGKKVSIAYEVKPSINALPLPKQPVQMMLPSPGMFSPANGVNPRFTFDSFVVGKCNSFAYEVAMAVSDEDLSRYNPVYFNSDIGLGKSHIAHSIGNRVMKTRPKARIKYTSTREFSQEYVFASRNNCMDKFRQSYRGGKTDIFFLDDVHILNTKEKTQMELSSIIDEMMHSGTQVIFSGYRPPSSIQNLDRSLKSRFEGGLVIDIKKPDYGTRASIVRSKGIREGVIIKDDVVDYVSKNIDTNIRELESAIITLCAMGTLMKRDISLELAREVLEGALERRSKIDLHFILNFTARHFGISTQALVSPSRKKELVYPRQVAIYLCRRFTKETLQSIGDPLKRKHTSIMHSLEVMDLAYKNNLKIKKEVDWLIEKIEKE